jgi:glycerate 2-kinase
MLKRIVIACDSFKGCLSSADVNSAVEEGVRAAGLADVEVVKFPLADGGEGTVDALVHSCGGEYVEREVCGPLAWGGAFPRPCGQSFPEFFDGRSGQSGPAIRLSARYALIRGGRVAVIETAAASGLALLRPEERNPLLANTFGTGELILDALQRGCRDFIIGLGGSASNDGGLGALSALGFRFLDSSGQALDPCGASLLQVSSFVRPEHKLLSDCTFRLATDVRAPFSGPQGAACIFAPQKGADPQKVADLDRGLAHFADILRRSEGVDLDATPGAGAAGGLAGGLLALLPGADSDASAGLSASAESLPSVTIVPGADLVLSAGGFDELLNGATLVITGEGCIDSQTLMGKAPSAVLRRASAAGVPVIAIGGSVSSDFAASDFAAVLAATPSDMPLSTALRPDIAKANISRAIASFFRPQD